MSNNMDLFFPVWNDAVACGCVDPENPCAPSEPPKPDPNNPDLTCPFWSGGLWTGLFGSTWDVAIGVNTRLIVYGDMPSRPFSYPADIVLGGPEVTREDGTTARLHALLTNQNGAAILDCDPPFSGSVTIPAGTTGLYVIYSNPLDILPEEAGVGYFSVPVIATSACTYPAP